MILKMRQLWETLHHSLPSLLISDGRLAKVLAANEGINYSINSTHEVWSTYFKTSPGKLPIPMRFCTQK